MVQKRPITDLEFPGPFWEIRQLCPLVLLRGVMYGKGVSKFCVENLTFILCDILISPFKAQLLQVTFISIPYLYKNQINLCSTMLCIFLERSLKAMRMEDLNSYL